MPRSIEAQLAEIRSRSLLRRLREVTSANGTLIELNHKTAVNFSSNDYLGLAGEPCLREAAKRAIDEWGVGAGASRLVCGTLAPHAELERTLAEWKRTDAALTFSSGYAAAVGTLGALLGRDDVVIIDKLAHASLVDGARLSGARLRVFPHNHLGKLESHLRWARDTVPDARVLVVTESVFSMDGDRAPLADVVEIKNRYGAMLLLDEAHAVGVIGENGRGLAEECGVAADVDMQMGTLSKALGTSGGYICAARPVIDLLINRARSFIYSTAPPPAIAAAARAAVALLMSEAGDERRKALWKNIAQFAAEAPRALLTSLPGGAPQSAIIPLILGNEDIALAAARFLGEHGFFAPAIRFPTVARGAARLRVTLSASHTPEEISAFCKALQKLSHAGDADE
jgi:8-amino-7-oxononanoate synthase